MGDLPWNEIRGFGNILRHGYDEIREDRIFDIAKNDVPALFAAAKRALE